MWELVQRSLSRARSLPHSLLDPADLQTQRTDDAERSGLGTV